MSVAEMPELSVSPRVSQCPDWQPEGAGMTFETHLTVQSAAANDPDEQVARQWALQRRIKWTHIELDRGLYASQPMLTFLGSGSLAERQAAGDFLTTELELLSVRVVRHKIESALTADDSLEPDQYFECHVKLQLHDDRQRQIAGHVASVHHAHVSRNARRRNAAGVEQRFLTLRRYEGTGADMLIMQQQLCDDLRFAGIDVLEVESERVVFDSNWALDSGWEE